MAVRASTVPSEGSGPKPKHKHKHKHKYEFFGPPGALIITLSITPITYLTHFLITPHSVPAASFLQHPLTSISHAITSTPLFSLRTLLFYILYFLFLILLQHILPGPHLQGVLLPNTNSRLTYKLNALNTSLVILGICAWGTIFHGGADWIVWRYLWEHNLELITSLNIFCWSLSTFLYLHSFSGGNGAEGEGKILAKGGQSGNVIYDWFIGRELNPRPIPFLPYFDLKSFCELRPGLILWMLFNFSNIAAQVRLHRDKSTATTLSLADGYLFNISTSALLTTIFQTWYVLDSHVCEPAVLTTMDITTDGFGHMLVFGDLAWVPLAYSIQTRFLAYHPNPLPPFRILIVLAVHLAGYFIFRGSNSQKNAFRTNPDDPAVSHLKYINTKRGTRLLISEWWGMARHINYLGDWTMAWAWSLTCGSGGYVGENGEAGVLKWLVGGKGLPIPIAYFYVVYFAILLIHRERRDDEACREKYGADWTRYTRIVRSRILPGVY